MQFSDVPMPAAVAARPRDPRGYPVPAITPWEAGQPVFAATGIARTLLCAVERRCSICGLAMPPGPVWRVVGGAEVAAIEAARAAGQPYRNRAATAEAPGHRACMLYAAVVCPYLARPNARRGMPASAAGLSAGRGDRRGSGGAVCGFESVEFRYVDTVLFRFADLIEFLPHEEGSAQLAELVRSVEAERSAGSPAPAYLLDDEDAAQARMDAYVDGRIPDV